MGFEGQNANAEVESEGTRQSSGNKPLAITLSFKFKIEINGGAYPLALKFVPAPRAPPVTAAR